MILIKRSKNPKVGIWHQAETYIPEDNTIVNVSFVGGKNVLDGIQLAYIKDEKWHDLKGELIMFNPLIWSYIPNPLDDEVIFNYLKEK
jgi:hypothetical protein